MTILTQHQDNFRSGFNPNETVLTAANVKEPTFGKLQEYVVDGSVYAQPLVARNIQLPGQPGTLDVLYVCTMHNSVYAFDASNAGNKQLWHLKLGDSIQLPHPGIGPEGGLGDDGKPRYKDIAWEVGIVSTPTIDTDAGLMFVVATNQDTSNNIAHTLWKLGLDGTILGQTQLAGSFGDKTWISHLQIQRPGLALANGIVYLAFAAYGDRDPWQGWILGYKIENITSTTIAPDYVFCTMPSSDSDGAGIWQAGQGPAVDEQGNLYFMTGNGYTRDGPNNSTDPGRGKFGCSVLKLRHDLTVADYFAPMDAISMSDADDDLGSGGIMVIPDSNLVIGGGKRNILYLMNRDNLGGYDTTRDNVVQRLNTVEDSDPKVVHHIHGSPVYYPGPQGTNLFVWPESMELKQLSFKQPGSSMSLAIAARTTVLDPDQFPGGTRGMPGGFLTVSSNGSPAAAGTGVLWGSHPYQGDANQSVRSGVLRAFDPENVANNFWSSHDNYNRDDLGNFAKFVAPTVANGRVYQATMGGLQQKTTTTQQTKGTPALANQGDKLLMLAWADQDGAMKTMISPDGLTWDPASLATVPGQTSQFQPSLAFDPAGVTYLAWTDASAQGSGRINTIRSSDPALLTWTDPVTTPETSISGPALAFGAGRLFVAWTDTSNTGRIVLASTSDGGATWTKKTTLPETSSARPSLVFNTSTNTLILTWIGRGNNNLNFLEFTDLDNLTPGKKTTLTGQTSPHGFGVAYDNTNSPVVAFARSDGPNWLQTATSETQDVDGFDTSSTRFRHLWDDNQNSNDGPSVASFKGTVFTAWVNAGLVNVAVLKRGSVCCYGLLEGAGAGSPAGGVPTLEISGVETVEAVRDEKQSGQKVLVDEVWEVDELRG